MIGEKYVRKLLAWCPKESLRRSIKVRVIRARKMRKGAFIGLFLISLPIGLLLLSYIPIGRTETIIDTSFVVGPGEKYGGRHVYKEGTYCHTNMLARPPHRLKGVVSVEGEGLYFSVVDYTNPVYVDFQYNFIVDVISSEQYFFAFDNKEGDAESSVRFLVKEEWKESLSHLGVIFGWYSSILLAPIGLILLIISYYISSDRTATQF